MDSEILKAEVMRAEYAELREASDYAGIARRLNASTTDANPEPQGQTPKRLTLDVVFQAIAEAAPADVAKLSAIPGWIVERVEQALAANDRAKMGNYLQIVGSQLSAASKTALTSLLAETEPDPNWVGVVSGPSVAAALGLGVVSASDVQWVLNS
ncbi:MAG: hypothetical protein E6Q97_10385 [Desulfurellales bacterium]|nr:MAG: hypothetical protein E6Q97_10385 [Desulfurellales bacterium]